MNKVMLIGNLTKDPEITTTSNGIDVCRFTLAVARKFSNSEGEREVDYINIVVWRTLATNCSKYLSKGSKCCVLGRMQVRNYDAQDGTKRYITEVIADEVEFLTNKKSVNNQELEEIEDENLPF